MNNGPYTEEIESNFTVANVVHEKSAVKIWGPVYNQDLDKFIDSLPTVVAPKIFDQLSWKCRSSSHAQLHVLDQEIS